jgi:anion-transporting  ArsA/GET3 family ATPase
VKFVKIHFVTGKGGVGKSTVAAALAQKYSTQGLKTLLVELGEHSFYSDFFDIPALNFQPQKSPLGFDLALWNGQDCLRDYAKHLIKIEGLYQIFFENPVSRALINVAPGLKELAILGKITSGAPRSVGPKIDYDIIVVDAFASGHFMALLKAPFGFSEAIKFGPMGEQTRGILASLKNPEITKYTVVVNPEELPAIEGMELAQDIFSLIQIKCDLLINKVWPNHESVTNGADVENKLHAYSQRLNLSQNLVMDKILISGLNQQKLDMVFSTQSKKIIEILTTQLGAAHD